MMEQEFILEVEKRKRLSEYYYINFEKHYAKKDLSKASEFLWGSINSLTYAIGLLYNKKLGKHQYIVDFIKELAEAYKDKEIYDLLAAANAMHANFYHDFMDETDFETNKEKVIKLIDKLTKILDDTLKEKL